MHWFWKLLLLSMFVVTAVSGYYGKPDPYSDWMDHQAQEYQWR